MRLKFRLYKAGALVREEEHTVSEFDLDTLLPEIAERHAEELAAHPHMIEIEFLDEPNPNARFFRFGTDPGGMVAPIKFDL